MKRDDQLRRIKQLSDDSMVTRSAMIAELSGKLIDAADQISAVLGSGHKLLLIGHGPLAAVASVLAAAFVHRNGVESHRAALPALALSTDAITLTSGLDDQGSDHLYDRSLAAFGKRGDLLIVLSSHGGAAPLLRSLASSRELGLISLGIVAAPTPRLVQSLDRLLLLPPISPARTVEEILFLGHVLIDLIEHDLLS